MEIFYPSDVLEVIRQMMAVFCWGLSFGLGVWFAGWIIAKVGELLDLFSWHR